ncbi:MAG: NAD(P)/FAD-dependent oxidoreductase, partial [Candidatus Heimdallarchaeota archaeon]
MVQSYDVIVVGAGPAGISVSIACANNGLKVLVIDKKTEEKIGDKVCGEAISKETTEIVAKELNIDTPKDNEINTQIENLVLRTSLPIDHIILPAIGYMINRHRYGQRLLKDAKRKGVNLLPETKVIKPIIEEKKVVGVLVKAESSKIEEYFASYVIDCSGLMAIIRTNLPDDFEPLLNNQLNKTDYAPCYREIIELEEKHDFNGKIVLQYEEDIPEPGYIWFFGDGEKKINCGTGFIKEGKNKDKSVKSVYFKAMEKYFPKGSYKVIDGRGDSVPIRPPLWNAVAPGLIVVGDAAFHADPLTAEGHGPAMLAGLHAGETATYAIRNNKHTLKDLWIYNKKVLKSFGAEHAR